MSSDTMSITLCFKLMRCELTATVRSQRLDCSLCLLFDHHLKSLEAFKSFTLIFQQNGPHIARQIISKNKHVSFMSWGSRSNGSTQISMDEFQWMACLILGCLRIWLSSLFSK
ncbi:hypothetical protein YC2023_075675 [Brassica napus]